MLSLDSPKWKDLQHAYGSASDIPALLRQLESFPYSDGNTEPWFSIWSALAHQGDVYNASFASIPHIVRVLKTSPTSASFDYFQFPVWVEICRLRNSIEISDDLSAPYFDALKMLGHLACEAVSKEWSYDFIISALSALALSKGSVLLAEVIQELDEDSAREFLKAHR